MNTSAVAKTKDRSFSKDLGAVNEDWPLLAEISQKQGKLVLNKNKKANLNIAKTAQEMVDRSSSEDEQVSFDAQQDDAKFINAFTAKPTKVMDATPVNDVNIEQEKQEITEPVLQTKMHKVEKTEKTVSSPEKVEETKSFGQEILGSNPLLKLIAIGLTKLYVKKTTTVLNPVKFVADNFKEVLVAVLHMGLPALMTWFLLTQVEFIKVQVADVATPVFWLYACVFYFASLFSWVSGQVIAAGLVAMFKNTLVSVARDAQRDQD